MSTVETPAPAAFRGLPKGAELDEEAAEYWASLPKWNQIELLRLLSGENPLSDSEKRHPDGFVRTRGPNVEAQRELREYMERYFDGRHAEVPADWLGMVREIGVDIPPVLAEAVARHAPRVTLARVREDHSDALRSIEEAAGVFWYARSVVRKDAETHPKDEAVIAWFARQGFSLAHAELGAELARPRWAPVKTQAASK